MKLVEILARELEKWPEGAHVAVQDSDIDKTIWYLPPKHQELTNNGGEWACESCFDILISEPNQLATDHATAIVTRADWEVEREKLKAPKANGDGWIRHRGGKCPVEAGVAVEYRMRSGTVMTSQTGSLLSWDHCDWGSDIMAYKIHKPAEQLDPAAHKHQQPAEQQSTGQDLHGMLRKMDGPDVIKWRDRIRELDTQRAEVDSTYQRQISEITQERESLVQKLAGEGLLIAPID